ncbi:MAG: hypothetical protein KAJ03_04270 [Gammaproteobacteria bacterium]|nr:hypothetical protein [Gammaproteobacteria bacterium]
MTTKCSYCPAEAAVVLVIRIDYTAPTQEVHCCGECGMRYVKSMRVIYVVGTRPYGLTGCHHE